MATVETRKSPQGIQEYLNSITLPVGWYVIGSRGYFTFISTADVVAGGPNGIVCEVAKSPDELESKLNALSGAMDLLFVLPHGGFWLIVSGPGATVISATVTVYKSAQALADGTGLVVVPGLDDETANSDALPEPEVTLNNLDPADLLTTYGGTYTLIKALPAGLTILQNGGFYTTILIS